MFIERPMRISWFTALGRTNNELLGVAMISLSAIVGAFLVLNQETHLFWMRLCDKPMEPSEIMLFFAFLVGVSDPLRKLGDFYNMIQTGVVAADRVFPLYDKRPRVQDPAQPQPLDLPDATIRLENIHFGYDPEVPVLKGVDLEIPSGSSLAIIGVNGCGKSTLVNLLLRFYDPDQGTIQLGKHDIREYRLHDLRRSIAYVTQQTMLFNDTIANNIRYGSLEASDAQVEEAARKAHASDFIERLEQKYDTFVGESGGRLSGGQRQRLALARAILKDPAVLILDEATSQVDPESETLIHESLHEFIQGRTTVMITHRLSTLDLADRILVMNEGAVEDVGTHQELLGRCKSYRRLRATELEGAA